MYIYIGVREKFLERLEHGDARREEARVYV